MKDISYLIQKILIFIAHILLLIWIYYVLRYAGKMSVKEVLAHFLGLAIFGGSLIRFCAFWARHRYLKESQD